MFYGKEIFQIKLFFFDKLLIFIFLFCIFTSIVNTYLFQNNTPNKIDTFTMKKTFDTWNFSPPVKNQIKVINFVNFLVESFNYSKKKIRHKKSKLYESQNLYLTSNKATKEIKWKTIMSQNDVIEYIVQWYKSYFKKKNMKIFSLNQINSFYKLARSKN